jgi:hypothetical protein
MLARPLLAFQRCGGPEEGREKDIYRHIYNKQSASQSLMFTVCQPDGRMLIKKIFIHYDSLPFFPQEMIFESSRFVKKYALAEEISGMEYERGVYDYIQREIINTRQCAYFFNFFGDQSVSVEFSELVRLISDDDDTRILEIKLLRAILDLVYEGGSAYTPIIERGKKYFYEFHERDNLTTHPSMPRELSPRPLIYLFLAVANSKIDDVVEAKLTYADDWTLENAKLVNLYNAVMMKFYDVPDQYPQMDAVRDNMQLFKTILNIKYGEIGFGQITTEYHPYSVPLGSLIRDNTPYPQSYWKSVIFQVFAACFVLGRHHIQHNDLHSYNIQVERRPVPIVSTCRITDTADGTVSVWNFSHVSTHKVFIFDWDMSHVDSQRDNPRLENYARCGALHECNRLVQRFREEDRARVYALINIVMITASLCGCFRPEGDPLSPYTVVDYLTKLVAAPRKLRLVHELFSSTCLGNRPIPVGGGALSKFLKPVQDNYALGRETTETYFLDDSIYEEGANGLFKTPLEMLHQLATELRRFPLLGTYAGPQVLQEVVEVDIKI